MPTFDSARSRPRSGSRTLVARQATTPPRTGACPTELTNSIGKHGLTLTMTGITVILLLIVLAVAAYFGFIWYRKRKARKVARKSAVDEEERESGDGGTGDRSKSKSRRYSGQSEGVVDVK